MKLVVRFLCAILALMGALWLASPVEFALAETTPTMMAYLYDPPAPTDVSPDGSTERGPPMQRVRDTYYDARGQLPFAAPVLAAPVTYHCHVVAGHVHETVACGGEVNPVLVSQAGVAADSGVSLSLKYKDGWTAAQRAAADEKVAALDAIAGRGDAVVAPVVRSAGSAAGKLRRAGIDVPPGFHGDHLHDLQLGGADTLENLWPLDGSVNSSLGAEIASQIRDLPVGTCVVAVRIC